MNMEKECHMKFNMGGNFLFEFHKLHYALYRSQL